MNETTTRDLAAVEDLQEYQRTLDGPEWLADLRAAAFERFVSSGWPTTREEEWRRSNLSAFEFDTYAVPVDAAARPSCDTRPGSVGRAGLLEFADGKPVSSALSADLDGRVVFADLLTVVERHAEVAGLVRSALEASLADADNRLQHWHFSMLANAAVLYVPGGLEVDAPFEVIESFGGDEIVHAPHFVVLLGPGARASVVRRLVSVEEGEVLVVDGGELVVDEGARLQLLGLQRLNDESIVFSHERGSIGRDAHIHRTEAALGADFVKARYVSDLTGPGADAMLNGIYFTVDEQHADLRTVQRHRAPHTTSRAFYRGAASDESHAIYQGLIQVDAAAGGTDAYLTNRNLILSESARADSIPSLNIKTDDVRCSHGSTTGRLDEEQMYYLQCRGYTASEAKKLLLEGYFEDLIAQTPEAYRDELRELIMVRIPEGD